MKTVIVHDSRYGNGARVADAFRDVWEEAGDEVVVAHVSQYDPARLVGDAPDLVVVGAAVRMFSVSRASKRWMSRAARELRVRGTRVPHATTFLTHGLDLDRIVAKGDRLRRRMCTCCVATSVYPDWLSAKVTGTQGPLADGTLDRARRFAGAVREWALSDDTPGAASAVPTRRM